MTPPNLPPNEPPRRSGPPGSSFQPNTPSKGQGRERSYQPISPARSQEPPRLQPGQLLGKNSNKRDRDQNRKRRLTRNAAPEAPYDYERARPTPGRPVRPRFRWGPFIGYIALTLVVIAALTALFASTRLFNFLGNISVARKDTNGQVISASSVTGHGRVTLLLLGLDRRPNDAEGTRSDTMILVSVDQDNKTANILSIPRDLWLKIPGHGSNRINTAYFFGEQEKPGQGGPLLAKQAIFDNFGVRVDYFAEIDFNGFRSIIDSIGGINIDVKKPLIDNEYPTEDYGIKRIYIPAGFQHLDGQTALQYARSRHADSDLGRNQRQQEVLLAVREQGVNLGLLTNTQLQTALQGAIKTDLSPGDMLGLGQVAVGMKRDSIKQFAIDANIAHNARIDGNDVLQADPAALSQLVRDFQTIAAAPASSGPAARETAHISVLNGTFLEGRAARTQKFLEGKGFTIDSIDQASDAGKYPRTVINVYNGKQKTAAELAGLLGVSPDHILTRSGGPTGVDVEVICGDDLKLPDQP